MFYLFVSLRFTGLIASYANPRWLVLTPGDVILKLSKRQHTPVTLHVHHRDQDPFSIQELPLSLLHTRLGVGCTRKVPAYLDPTAAVISA
jgi:hypothetical protein